MESNKKKHTGSNILIIMLILIILASTGIGLYSWAKYQSTVEGTATGETAKWSFNVKDGNTETSDIDFPMTRTDNNDSVVEGKLAPGTYGELKLEIDATGTETALTYIIEGTMQNLPTNMKFYSDAERTVDLMVLDGKFTKSGYMKLSEIGEKIETIYWEWPFETNTSPAVTDEKLANLGIDKEKFDAFIVEGKFVEANDMIDTAESNKQASMKISVTGKQLNGNPVLSDLVQVGDYVNYDASSNGTKTFTSANWVDGSRVLLNKEEATISTDDVFNSSAKAQWRVLSVNREEQIVELISIEPTQQKIELSGIDGYYNVEDALNNVGELYGQGKGAVGGRSINISDIEKYSNYDKNKYENDSGFKYNDDSTYTLKTPDNTSLNLAESEVEKLTGSVQIPSTVVQTFYSTDNENIYINSIINKILLKNNTDENILKSNYWITSNCIALYSNYCDFLIHVMYNGNINGARLYTSTGKVFSNNFGVVPVVTLQTSIQTTGKDANGVWQLKVD